MGKIDADSLLDDFQSEAKTHIEKIESAFLDVDALVGAPALMDGVFRAAHSLKGTAGFFSLEKIVTVAHELESVFSRIKNGSLALSDEIADVTLQGVDYLKDLVNNIHAPDSVNTDGLLELLKGYSETSKREKSAGGGPIRVPFDLANPGTAKILKNAEKRGQRIYYLDIRFDRSLGRYYSYPETLIGDILSIGSVVAARIDGAEAEASELAAEIARRLAAGGVSELDLLVTSVLEPELFLIAVELEERFVHLVPRESAPEKERGEAPAPPAGEAAGARETPAPQGRREADFSISLDVSIVNGLMDLANEMILARNRLLSATLAHRKSIAGLTPILHDIDRLTSEIQEKVMRTRMQPISLIFKKYPRVIRDIAKSLQKEIQVEIFGGDVALDKYLLDSLSDPITQLVKNSAGHGIESAERRAALGKPQRGVITLAARMHDGSAVIEVSDDGAGIDSEALRRKGLEQGLASEEQLAAMSGKALFALIFEPGFSTAKEVTNVSGRGVGMDIVKTNIEKLGGSIEIESEPGRGTTTRLRMPLTLSVTGTLIVTIASVQYAVPESGVDRIVRASGGADARRLERVCDSLALNLDGWVLPAVTLEEVDARVKGLPPPAETILERRLTQEVSKCLVLRAGGRYFALLIDDAVTTEETLVKPLPLYFQSCRCYSGITVLGNGKAIMILDPEGIMRVMEIAGVERPAPAAEERAEGDVRRVIVFRCSGAEHFALDAGAVARIERVNPAHIQEIDDRRFINTAGRSVRLIRPEDCAPVQKRDYEEEKLCMLLLAGSGGDAPPVGLLARKVLDQIEDVFALDGGLLENQYVLGTSAYREKILIFLNAEEILRSIEAERAG